MSEYERISEQQLEDRARRIAEANERIAELEARIAGLEALLCDAQEEIERLKVQGSVKDCRTP